MAKKPERYTIEYYEEQIKQAEATYEEQVRYARTAIAVLQRIEIHEDDDFNVLVYKYYLKYRNGKIVASALSEAGFRYKDAKHDRNYTSNDVSRILREETIADTEMMNLARDIFAGAKKSVDARYN